MTTTPDLVDPAEVGMSAEHLGHAADLMDHQFAEGSSPILAAIVARHGKVVFTKVLGDQRPGGPPLALDSVFPLASNGKPMTAATLLALVERGLVGLTEPVVDYLPELSVNDNTDVLVHHLLTHTGGWSDDDLMAALAVGLEAGISEPPPGRDLLEHLFLDTAWSVPRVRGVGEVMQYATHNYTFLGEIIRRVTGDTLDAAMRRYLLEPVRMTDTAVIVPDELLPRVIERPEGIPHAPGHPDTQLANYDPLFLACDDGGFGVHSTVLDCLAFLEMIRNGGMVGNTRVLCADSIRVMTTDQIPGTSAEIAGTTLRDASWGYGFSVGGPSPVMHWRGGTAARGTLRHAGSGGIGSWMDPVSGVAAVYHELVTVEIDGMPVSWAIDRFEDIITAAVLD